MSHVPVVISVYGDEPIVLTAVFKITEYTFGIDYLLSGLPASHRDNITKKIIIGPSSNAANALRYNELYEKKLKKKKDTINIRAPDYAEKRKRAVQEEEEEEKNK
jgi:hypothetical protein